MLGAGHTPLKRKLTAPTSASEEETAWVSLDMNPDAKPDVLFDLSRIERPWWRGGKRLPFADGTFDEVHVYEVLEHYGRQGDYRGFFRGMNELWRVLKQHGLLIGTCPSWNVQWTWGDPGHIRVITEGTLSYLTREMGEEVGKGPATDYRRFVSPCWWKMEFYEHHIESGGLRFAMRKAA